MALDRFILVLGSGPGIGVGVATCFAEKGFNKVALLSRNAERLKEDATAVSKAAPSAEVKTYTADLADSTGLKAVLSAIEAENGRPEVVVYNASHLTMSKLGEYSEAEIETDLKISTVSLYTTATWALPLLVSLSADPSRKPSLLVTSGGLYRYPRPGYFSLALSKAAQHNLTMSMHQEYASKGVHVAAVPVVGRVSPESEHFSPKRIAGVFWDLYQQGAEKGAKEAWVTTPEHEMAGK
ncbi:uncharacterized protein PV09_02217 [Verruconis gallopava]|uniref:NAD(P)-binding protein n=1 Tax=Verruconis gallopava TaxID=253628 RepID=A0A0D1Z345_9PEZI|nr:uncharacterized protein PV09_02217 [Verruconis gallopava]KIW07372.1 hypothetical protein PV09_02217 [Verruconis gallopava]